MFFGGLLTLKSKQNLNGTPILKSCSNVVTCLGSISGKSTLVRTINLLQRPTEGKVIVGGKPLLELSNAKLRQARKKIGMIFQHFNLLNSRTVLGNVEYPLLSQSISKADRRAKAKELLDLVGLSEFEQSYPGNFSNLLGD